MTITETAMTSTATAHTARRAGRGWGVTWLPGRTLTRNQAITAMTIAELAITTPQHVLDDPAAPVWAHLGNWAAELGLSLTEEVISAVLTGGAQ